MKLKLIRKNQQAIISEKLELVEVLGSYDSETYTLSLNDYGNLLITINGKPNYITQFDVGMWLVNSKVLSEFVNDKEITVLDKYEKLLPKFILKSNMGKLVGVSEDPIFARFLLADRVDLDLSEDVLSLTTVVFKKAKDVKDEDGLTLTHMESNMLPKPIAKKLIEKLERKEDK